MSKARLSIWGNAEQVVRDCPNVRHDDFLLLTYVINSQ